MSGTASDPIDLDTLDVAISASDHPDSSLDERLRARRAFAAKLKHLESGVESPRGDSPRNRTLRISQVRNRTLRISQVRNRTLRISQVRNRTLRISHISQVRNRTLRISHAEGITHTTPPDTLRECLAASVSGPAGKAYQTSADTSAASESACCAPCVAGKYSCAGLSACIDCAAGKYRRYKE